MDTLREALQLARRADDGILPSGEEIG